VPIGFYCFVFATPIVALFYKSHHFNESAVTESAIFLKLLAVTVFSIGINAMVTRLFIAVQAIRPAFFYQVVLNVLLIAATWICIKYYGAYGYPYAVIIMNLVNFITMYFICRKLVPQINYAALIKYAGLIILINMIIATGLYFAVSYFMLNGLLNIIFGFMLYLIALLILNKKFNLNTDLGYIFKYIKQKFC
jgi:peptidoglycan biosynthesis protein MviN/MurJ (putative lipid II flippase)